MKTNLTHIKISVSNITKSLEWYVNILGFEVDSSYPSVNPIYYDFKSDGGACFSIGQHDNPNPNGRINFQTENVEALWEELKDKAIIIEPLWDTPWGIKNLL